MSHAPGQACIDENRPPRRRRFRPARPYPRAPWRWSGPLVKAAQQWQSYFCPSSVPDYFGRQARRQRSVAVHDATRFTRAQYSQCRTGVTCKYESLTSLLIREQWRLSAGLIVPRNRQFTALVNCQFHQSYLQAWRERNQLRRAAQAQAAKNILTVLADGKDAKAQQACDFLARVALHDEIHDLPFAAGKCCS